MVSSVRFGVAGLLAFLTLTLQAANGQLTTDTRKCPEHLNRAGNLIAWQGRCYDVVTYHPLTWQDAREKCVAQGGRLMEVHDMTTNDFITRYLSTLEGVGTGVWVGITDAGTEGTWRWNSGRPVAFTHWASDEPGGFTGWLDDCGLMKLDGFWYDFQCDIFYQHYSYVCMYDAID